MICPRSHSHSLATPFPCSLDHPIISRVAPCLLRDCEDFSFPFKDHDSSLKNSAFHCLLKVLSMQGARLMGDLKKCLNNGLRIGKGEQHT